MTTPRFSFGPEDATGGIERVKVTPDEAHKLMMSSDGVYDPDTKTLRVGPMLIAATATVIGMWVICNHHVDLAWYLWEEGEKILCSTRMREHTPIGTKIDWHGGATNFTSRDEAVSKMRADMESIHNKMLSTHPDCGIKQQEIVVMGNLESFLKAVTGSQSNMFKNVALDIQP